MQCLIVLAGERLELNSTQSKLATHETDFGDNLCRFTFGGPPGVDKSIPFILSLRTTAGQATWRHSLLEDLLDLELERCPSRLPLCFPSFPLRAGLPRSLCGLSRLLSDRDERDDVEDRELFDEDLEL